MLFSFLLVNYRSAQYLSDWFASLTHTGLSSEEYEVIVVNNDPGDFRSLQTLQEHWHFHLIEAKKNLGFGRGHNRAASEAKGKIIAFCNPDSRFLPGDLHRLAEQFEEDSELVLLSPRLLTETAEIQKWGVGAEVTLLDLITNNLGFPRSRKLWESKEPIEVAWVSGACMFVRRNDFESLGGFDEQFFLYFEDVDLCARARKAGKKVLYFPKIEVIHLGGKSSPSRYQQKKDFYTSQDLYFRKHRGSMETFAVNFFRHLFFL